MLIKQLIVILQLIRHFTENKQLSSYSSDEIIVNLNAWRRKIYRSVGFLPRSLMITDVKTERDPRGGGRCSDLYKGRKGRYRNQVVAIEVLRFGPTGTDIRRIREVCGPSAEFSTINPFYIAGSCPGSIVLVTA